MPNITIQYFDEIDSTNSYLKRSADKLCDLTAAVAKTQTGGRGRLGRSFFSPENGLYFSLLLKSGISVSDAHLLTPMTAVAVCEALESCGAINAGIKWVNDIYIAGRKVCGILTETRISQGSGELEYAVIGVGINLFPPNGGFPEDIKNRAGTAFERFIPDLRERVLNEALARIADGTKSVAEKRFLESYRSRSILIGREVTVIRGDESFNARVLGIDDECRLICEADGGKVALNSGEVSIKI